MKNKFRQSGVLLLVIVLTVLCSCYRTGNTSITMQPAETEPRKPIISTPMPGPELSPIPPMPGPELPPILPMPGPELSPIPSMPDPELTPVPPTPDPELPQD
jgi:hypothetical protein